MPIAPRAGGDVFPFNANGQADRFSQRDREVLVRLGCRAQLMIEVSDADHAQPPGGVELAQEVCQRNRIRPTRERDDGARVAARQIVAIEKGADPIDDVHDGWPRGCGG